MGTIELISAILLILSCVFIIVIVFFQGGSKPGMSQTITGQSSDNYYQKNSGRSKEMRLKKFTVAAAVIFFTVAIAVNVVTVYVERDIINFNRTPSSDNGTPTDATTTAAEAPTEAPTGAATDAPTEAATDGGEE